MPPKKKGTKAAGEAGETLEEGAKEAKEEAKEEAKVDEPKAAETKPAEAEKSVEPEKEKEEEKPKEPEKPKELEEDAKPVKGAKVGTVGFDMSDATLNVMPTAGGSLLMTLSDGGLQYLLASVRSNTGIKSGRYMFEVKMVETLNPAEGQNGKARAPAPRHLVRVGFSTKGSSVFLSDGPDNVCFDSEGFFIHEKKRTKVSQKFGRDQVLGVLLNLDNGPNKNTVSVFRDGQRISEPQALPENLQGQTLFPTITYRNVTLQVNYGPSPLAPLPFKCHMLSDASEKDVQVTQAPAEGKCEVMFPVGLPETGLFDWVDGFLAKNPTYTELSDRKILDWAAKSGLWRQKGYSWKATNDDPEMGFGIPMMDDNSVSRLLTAIAPTLKRNFVVMQLKSNLIAAERAEALARFRSENFNKVAAVVMGEPNAEYKKLVQDLLLAEKKKKADAERKKKSMEAERKRLAEERQKKAEAAKKARLAAQKKDKDEEEEQKEESKEEEKKEDVLEDEGPPPELTEEEKKLTHRSMDASDLATAVLAKSFANFSIPSKSEGFTTVKFEWQAEKVCEKILKEYVHEKKMTERVESLTPGEWFTEEWKKWTKTLQEWRSRQSQWKDPIKRKQLLAKKKEAEKKEGEEGDSAAASMEVNAEDLDVWTDVKDVMDIGSGEPLFANFAYEDWALLSIRYELHLLVHGFKKDLDDPERPSFVETHAAYYYNKYFKKAFNVKLFGVADLAGLVELIKESVKINEKNMLECGKSEDTPFENFVKLTEDHRRERQRRMDAGDETAQLKFTKPSPPPPKQGQRPQAPSYPPSGSRAGSPASYGAPRYPSYGAGGGGAQKRPYTPAPAAYNPNKAPRTQSYHGSQGGYRR